MPNKATLVALGLKEFPKWYRESLAVTGRSIADSSTMSNSKIRTPKQGLNPPPVPPRPSISATSPTDLSHSAVFNFQGHPPIGRPHMDHHQKNGSGNSQSVEPCQNAETVQEPIDPLDFGSISCLYPASNSNKAQGEISSVRQTTSVEGPTEHPLLSNKQPVLEVKATQLVKIETLAAPKHRELFQESGASSTDAIFTAEEKNKGTIKNSERTIDLLDDFEGQLANSF